MKILLIFCLLLSSICVFGQISRHSVVEFTPIEIPNPYLSTQKITDIYFYKKEQALNKCVRELAKILLEARESGDLQVIDSTIPSSSWIEYLELLKFKDGNGTIVIMVAKEKVYLFNMNPAYYFLWKRASSAGDYYHREVENESRFSLRALCEEEGY